MRKIVGLVAATLVVVAGAAEIDTISTKGPRLQGYFQWTFSGIATWQWMALAFIILVCSICALVVQAVARRITRIRDKFAPQPMDEPTRRAIARWVGVLAGSLLASSMLPDIELPTGDHLAGKVKLIVHGLLVLSTVLIVYSYWDLFCDTIASRASGHRRAERLLVPMMRKFVRAIIVLVGLLVALAIILGPKTVTGLVAGLGVSGLVIAFAAKDSIENVFGSLTILFDMPFALEDWVKIDKVEGKVEEINLRSTRIRTAEDTLITLPNANLIRAAVENFGARRTRRQRLNIRLSYDCKPEAIEAYCAALREYVKQQPKVDKTRISIELDDPTETSIGLLVEWFIDVSTKLKEAKSRNEVLEEAMRLRKEHGVLFAAAPRPPDPAPA